MGGRRTDLALLAQKIFHVTQVNHIKLLSHHIPGELNHLLTSGPRITQIYDDSALRLPVRSLSVRPRRFRPSFWAPHDGRVCDVSGQTDPQVLLVGSSAGSGMGQLSGSLAEGGKSLGKPPVLSHQQDSTEGAAGGN